MDGWPDHLPAPPPHVALALQEFDVALETLIRLAGWIGGTEDRSAAISYVQERVRGIDR